jgi:hypothetical protein
VAWSEVRNLGTERIDIAARMMQATAYQSVRSQKPVYHLSINWPQEENPNRAGMEIAVDRVLSDLGLEEHQAVVVAHNDTAHPHVHVMVNRVHPETLKTWSNRHDWRRIETTLRELETSLGWRRVQGRHTPAPTRADRPRGARPTSGETQQTRRLGRATPVQELRDKAREPMRDAKSWPELEYRLHQAGLRLERRGGGMTVTDGKHFSKASAVRPDASLPQLERRFNERYPHWRQQRIELQQLARKLDRIPVREQKVAAIERRLRVAEKMPPRRRQDLERRAETLRGRGINPVKVFRKIRGLAIRLEERIVWWVSPTAGKVLQAHNRLTGLLMRPVEKAAEMALTGKGRRSRRPRQRGRGRGRGRSR